MIRLSLDINTLHDFLFVFFTSGSYNENLWRTLINFMKSFNFIMKTSKLRPYG